MPFFKSIEDQDKVPHAFANFKTGIERPLLTCTWSFMNRFLEGIGLTLVPEQFAKEGELLKGGYDGIFKMFDLN